MKKVKRISAASIILFIFLLLLSVFILYPLVYSVFGSFKSTQEFMNGGPNILPKVWRFQNYVDAVRIAKFDVYTLNSFKFALLSVIGVLITCSMTGFILARVQFRGKKMLIGGFAASLFMTGAVTIFPAFDVCLRLGLLNSLLGVVIVQVAWSQPLYSVLIMGYCSGISKSIDESAKIDGCGVFRIYFSIMLPIIKPILATVALLQFREAWNSYMLPLAFTLAKPELRTLAVGVVSLRDTGEGISSWNLMIAGTVISLVPILIIYLFMNKFFIGGITDGAVKG